MEEKSELFIQYLKDSRAEKYYTLSLQKFLRDTFTHSGRELLLQEIIEDKDGGIERYMVFNEFCKRYPDRIFAKLDERSRREVARIAELEHFTNKIYKWAFRGGLVLLAVYYMIKKFV